MVGSECRENSHSSWHLLPCSPGWHSPCDYCVFGGRSVDRSWRCSCEPVGIQPAKFLVASLGTVSSLFNALFSPAVAWCSSFLQHPLRYKGEKYHILRSVDLSTTPSAWSGVRFRLEKLEDSVKSDLNVWWERKHCNRGGSPCSLIAPAPREGTVWPWCWQVNENYWVSRAQWNPEVQDSSLSGGDFFQIKEPRSHNLPRI